MMASIGWSTLVVLSSFLVLMLISILIMVVISLLVIFDRLNMLYLWIKDNVYKKK